MCPLVDAFARLDPNAPRLGTGGKPVECREDLLRLFEDARLNDVVTEAFDVTKHYASFEDYWAETLLARDFGPVGAYFKGLGTEQLKDVWRILSEIVPPDDTGKVVFTGRACGIRGVVR